MRSHADHGRRGGLGGRGAGASRAARVAGVVLAGGLAGYGTFTAATSAATTAKPVAARDAEGDQNENGPDLTRVQLGLSKDGRMRAAITLSDDVTPEDWVSDDGPPGSVCLRVWTLTKPGTVPPDFLVCASADSKDKLRGTVAQEQVDAQPKRIADAKVTQSSDRTLVLTFSRTSVSGGKAAPTSFQFAAEANTPGCTRTSCIDTAPDAPKTLTLTLKKSG